MFVRSTKCKYYRVILAALLLAALLSAPVLAAEEAVGAVPCLLTSWSGRGALTDESNLGDAAADALRFVSGADAAIVCGGDIPDNALQPGLRTREEIREAFAEDRTIGVTALSVLEFKKLLESCVSHITVDLDTKKLDEEASAFDGFPQVSGITFRFDALAEPGERILWIKAEDGTKLPLDDDSTVLTVAASDYLLAGGYGGPKQETEALGFTYSDAMAAYIASGITTDYTRVHRMAMAGGNTETIIGLIPPWAIVLFVVAIGLYGYLRSKRRREVGANEWDERYEDPNDRPLL